MDTQMASECGYCASRLVILARFQYWYCVDDNPRVVVVRQTPRRGLLFRG